jgi:hypothetical protein
LESPDIIQNIFSRRDNEDVHSFLTLYEFVLSKYWNRKMSLFIRDIEDELSYRIHKGISRSVGISEERHIQSLLFTNHTGAVIIANRFPYRLFGNCRHYVLWLHPKHEKFWTESRIYVLIARFLRKKKLSLIEPIFVNTVANQSIRSIKHWHLLCER